MADKQRLVAPLEGDVLALGDVAEVDLDLGQRQHIGGGGQRRHEVGDNRLGAVSRAHAAS